MHWCGGEKAVLVILLLKYTNISAYNSRVSHDWFIVSVWMTHRQEKPKAAGLQALLPT